MKLPIYKCTEPGLTPCRSIFIKIEDLISKKTGEFVIFLREKKKLSTKNTIPGEFMNIAKLDDNITAQQIIDKNNYSVIQYLEINRDELKSIIFPDLHRFFGKIKIKIHEPDNILY